MPLTNLITYYSIASHFTTPHHSESRCIQLHHMLSDCPAASRVILLYCSPSHKLLYRILSNDVRHFVMQHFIKIRITLQFIQLMKCDHVSLHYTKPHSFTPSPQFISSFHNLPPDELAEHFIVLSCRLRQQIVRHL